MFCYSILKQKSYKVNSNLQYFAIFFKKKNIFFTFYTKRVIIIMRDSRKEVQMSRQIRDYLPESFKNIYEIEKLYEVLQQEIDNISNSAENFKDNLFVSTCNEETLLKYYNIMDIYSSNNIRDSIIAKLSSLPPFSFEHLEAIALQYVTECSFSKQENFNLELKYKSLTTELDLSDCIKELYNIIPACVVVNTAYMYGIWSRIKWVKWGEYGDIRWSSLKYQN